MFCKYCGKQIDDDSTFCSFCGLKQSALVKQDSNADRSIFNSPGQSGTYNLNKSNSTSFRQQQTKYDSTYEKELEVTLVGVIGFIVFFVLNWPGALNFETEESYKQALVIFSLLSLVYRFIVIVWIKNIATRQNRDAVSWQIFGFFLPSLALIVIGSLRKKIV